VVLVVRVRAGRCDNADDTVRRSGMERMERMDGRWGALVGGIECFWVVSLALFMHPECYTSSALLFYYHITHAPRLQISNSNCQVL
jgi:hypothetical protein